MNRAAVWLAAAVGLAVCAATVVSLTLFALAVGLVVVVASAAATVTAAARRVTVTRSLAEREVRENEPLLLSFGVHGVGGLPVRLEVLAGDEPGDEVWVPVEEIDGTMPLTVGRRGAYRLEPTPVRLVDIFGIFRRTVLAGEPEPVLVLPTPDAGARIPVPPGAPAEDLDPDGLRPYVPGSPVGRIHWASLARGGDLHERRFASPPAGLPLVIVETAGTEDPAELDWVARAAAGCVLRLAGSGGCKVMLPGDKAVTEVTDAGTCHAVHRRLATLDTAPVGSAPRLFDAGPTSVVRFPAGLVVPPPSPLPPGVVPMPAEAVPPAETGYGNDGAGQDSRAGRPPVRDDPRGEVPAADRAARGRAKADQANADRANADRARADRVVADRVIGERSVRERSVQRGKAS
ncbi:DUF58 domain-containing protein [Actinomadura sp. HBU206391]|uniref:DUF58 domain-containing protein n=1 Tax=Actinomadura sp. HBU206391 TaxID=2731692 RepID=UPI00164F873F|nr:DUF58 domain-containing protein [Actinomadura sp. HBU206391]MBC6459340.1 DUF58 domain-containing protein [Actinomadura sp. HBU206391]